MSVYKFFDTDPTGQEEYDINGTAYEVLLRTCFKYCNTFSILVNKNCTHPFIISSALERYRLPMTLNVEQVYSHYGISTDNGVCGVCNYEIRHYKLSPQVQNMIFGVTDSIFKWIYGWGHTNPDDPAFYRSDGSVFFYSIIHEGECTLISNQNEDVSNIISHGLWTKKAEDRYLL